MATEFLSDIVSIREPYGEMVRYVGDTDPTTRRMLEEILATEEEHAEDLASLLATLDSPAGA